MKKLKCLVVDDEKLARELIREYIEKLPFLEFVASVKNAFEAMEELEKKPIDLIFLDIQMPGMLGTTFLSTLKSKPMVIFVTAYDNYAVESYDLEVVDYLVKPVGMERFTKAAYKALSQSQRDSIPRGQNPESRTVDTSDHFFVHVEYALVKVMIKEITHIEGMKDYVKIFTTSAERPILTKLTLKALEEKLIDKGFLRVHRSYIVQTNKIEAIKNNYLHIGIHRIPVSQNHLDKLTSILRFLDKT
ncbi:MAG: LytTR family DNA-binding domain-containing protein [Saprospiraceae bacterium]|nr:LytTR family DNA-binding domain-containing protein [Saprospiraceae bacterium]